MDENSNNLDFINILVFFYDAFYSVCPWCKTWSNLPGLQTLSRLDIPKERFISVDSNEIWYMSADECGVLILAGCQETTKVPSHPNPSTGKEKKTR